MTPVELKKVLESGLLSFPLTDFDSQLRFAPKPYAARLEWLMPYGASALFAAGGTGEFFSIEPDEYSDVMKVAVDTCRRPRSSTRRKRSGSARKACSSCRTTSPRRPRKGSSRTPRPSAAA